MTATTASAASDADRFDRRTPPSPTDPERRASAMPPAAAPSGHRQRLGARLRKRTRGSTRSGLAPLERPVRRLGHDAPARSRPPTASTRSRRRPRPTSDSAPAPASGRPPPARRARARRRTSAMTSTRAEPADVSDEARSVRDSTRRGDRQRPRRGTEHRDRPPSAHAAPGAAAPTGWVRITGHRPQRRPAPRPSRFDGRRANGSPRCHSHRCARRRPRSWSRVHLPLESPQPVRAPAPRPARPARTSSSGEHSMTVRSKPRPSISAISASERRSSSGVIATTIARGGRPRTGTTSIDFSASERTTSVSSTASTNRWSWAAPRAGASHRSTPPSPTSPTRSCAAACAAATATVASTARSRVRVEADARLGEGVEEQHDVGVAVGVAIVHPQVAAAGARSPVDGAHPVADDERPSVGELDAVGPAPRLHGSR